MCHLLLGLSYWNPEGTLHCFSPPPPQLSAEKMVRGKVGIRSSQNYLWGCLLHKMILGVDCHGIISFTNLEAL